MSQLRKRMRNQRGVTLIELLVVVVILGIIAAVAIPMVAGNQDKAEEHTNLQNLNILQDALERYYIDHGKYPVATEGLEALTKKSADGKGPYLSKIPEVVGSTSNKEFNYNPDSEGKSYTLSIPSGAPGHDQQTDGSTS